MFDLLPWKVTFRATSNVSFMGRLLSKWYCIMPDYCSHCCLL